MTDKDLAVLVQAIAPIVKEYAAKAVSDAQARIAVLEAQLMQVGDVRDRVIVMETKASTEYHGGYRERTEIDLSPVLQRLSALETGMQMKFAEATPIVSAITELTKDVGDVRDRVIVIETKSAMPIPAPDFGDLRERLVSLERRVQDDMVLSETVDSGMLRDYAALRERVAVVETRPPVPGPPGEPGPPGINGKDGVAGLSFEGVYQEGQSYDKGNLVTWAGSSWHCNAPTTTKPGDGSKDWTLMVKRGRDGRDGLNGKDVVPVVKIAS